MKLDRVYNKVANTYNLKVSGDVLARSKQAAIDMVTAECDELSSILALGVGDASDLLIYNEKYPDAELHGLDISEAMLEKASALLNCKTYHGGIHAASSMITKKDFDLITAYFVTAYVPMPEILAQSHQLLPNKGHISILTNTWESFQHAQSLLTKNEKTAKFFDRLWIPFVKKAMKSVHVPVNNEHLRAMMEANGFRVKEFREEEILITLETKQDIFDFFIDGGWFVSGIAHPLIPASYLRKLSKRWIEDYVPVPFVDTLKIAVVLGERM